MAKVRVVIGKHGGSGQEVVDGGEEEVTRQGTPEQRRAWDAKCKRYAKEVLGDMLQEEGETTK